MKKTIHNIFGLRCLMIAVFAAVCGTSWAQVEGSPLAAWYDSNASGYVLRTIDDDHTVIHAMKALQEINTSGSDSWGAYSDCSFYLTEDVDFNNYKDDGGNKLNWVPLGTATNPFQSSFYCYHATFKVIDNNGNYVKVDDDRDLIPKYTPSIEDHVYKYSSGLYTYTMTKGQMIKVLYSNNSSDLVEIADDGTVTVTETAYNDYSNIQSDYSLPEEPIADGDGKNCTSKELIGGNETQEDAYYKYTFSADQILACLSESIPTTAYEITTPDDDQDKYIFSQTSADSGEFDDIFSSYIISDEDYSSQEIQYDLVPYFDPDCNLGYYYDDDNDATYYYSTDGHIGIAKIMNLTVDGKYSDGAGFFGCIGANIDLDGFTFEGCSVTNTAEDGYAGILYGTSIDGNAPSICDLFIGSKDAESNISRCSVEATYAGGVYGANFDTDGNIVIDGTSISSTKINDLEFDPDDLADDACDEEGFSINKIYVTITGIGHEISCTQKKANYTQVDADGLSLMNAFNGGTGTDTYPFQIATEVQVNTLIALVADPSNIIKYDDLFDDDGNLLESISNMCFKQTADITFSETLTEGIGSYENEHPFEGYYDGDGYTIKVNVSNDTYCALFAYTSFATIENLKVEGTNTCGGSDEAYLAGIIAYDGGFPTINHCIINVKLVGEEVTNKYGLVGNYCDGLITDSFNKGAKDLAFDANDGSSNNYFLETSAKGQGTSVYPLQISSLSDLNVMSECGLYYVLTSNLSDKSVRLYDINGTATLPEEATNEDYYVEKFCGTILGDDSDLTSDGLTSHIISGLTNKALFGTIVGDTEIKNIGFVNCYNADDNNKVKLASKIGKDAEENSYSLTLNECYSDTYFDFGDDATKNDCYEYNNGSVTYSLGETSSDEDIWVADAFSNRMVLKNTSVELTDDTYTDAIGTKPADNVIYQVAPSDDQRTIFKYNLADEGNIVSNMYLTDIMDYYDTSKTNSNITADNIKATDYTSTINGIATNVYYCRKHHNNWESVTLPFDYSLSDIQNEGFTAYEYDKNNSETTDTKYEENDGGDYVFNLTYKKYESYSASETYNDNYRKKEGGDIQRYSKITTTTTTATFTPMAENARIAAGTPVLFYNNGTNDFVVKASSKQYISNDGDNLSNGRTFIGVLQSTGNGTSTGKATIATSMLGKYKVAGAGNESGGDLLYCTKESWVYPFRAYLDFGSSGGAKTIRFFINNGDDSDPTQIDIVNGELVEHPTGTVYSLDGRKVSDNGLQGLNTGIYISGGKKYVVK